MAASSSIIAGKIAGARAWKAVLTAMPQAVRDEMADAVRTTASETVRQARANVPVKTGTLRDHIDFSFSERAVRAKVGITTGTVLIDGRLYRASHYAHCVEFGTKTIPQHPFLRPAIEGQRSPFEDRMRAAGRAVERDLASIGSHTV
jgi:HK97 gp10 family phage protein